jgi:hypothetical protein
MFSEYENACTPDNQPQADWEIHSPTTRCDPFSFRIWGNNAAQSCQRQPLLPPFNVLYSNLDESLKKLRWNAIDSIADSSPLLI